MLYSSINNEKIKKLKKLNTKKYRDLYNLFLVDGEHLVKEANDSGLLEEVLILENKDFLIDKKINYVTSDVLKYISNLDTPSGIMGVCKKVTSTLKGNRIVILEDIQDPGNLGTIIRSCVAFNIDTLILSSCCVDLYNSKVIRATQGMIFHLNIVVIDELDKFVLDLKNSGYRIYSTNVNNGKSLKSIEKSTRFAIIMGNEGNGVSACINSLADDYIYIDMNKSCESLNVGVATSIILYEFDK